MTIAYWCVLAIVLLPYVLAVTSRSAVARKEYVRDPRSYSDTLVGWRRRAHRAHLNAFEATPAFVAAIMVAQLAHAPQTYIDVLAVAFVGFRLAHGALYLADMPMLRSHAWRLGMLCIVALFVVAAWRGHA